MKKLTSSLLAVLLIAALLVGIGASAYADDMNDPFAEPVISGNANITDVVASADRLISYDNGGYTLLDLAGNVLSDTYAYMTSIGEDGYIEIENEDDMYGVMDADGNVVLPTEYGVVDVEGPFAAGITLKAADENDYDHVSFDDDFNCIYWNYDTVSVFRLSDGELVAELDGDDFSMLYWTDGVLEICDAEYRATYYDADFNEMSENEAFELFSAGDGYSYLWNSDSDKYGLVDADGNTVINAVYDDIYVNADGNYCVNGYFCAEADGVIYFFDETGKEVSETADLDNEYYASFYGDCLAVNDDSYCARTILHADGEISVIDEEYNYPSDMSCCGMLYIKATNDDYEDVLMDSYGNVLIVADDIYMTDSGFVICAEFMNDNYDVYCIDPDIDIADYVTEIPETPADTDISDAVAKLAYFGFECGYSYGYDIALDEDADSVESFEWTVEDLEGDSEETWIENGEYVILLLEAYGADISGLSADSDDGIAMIVAYGFECGYSWGYDVALDEDADISDSFEWAVNRIAEDSDEEWVEYGELVIELYEAAGGDFSMFTA